MQIAAPEIFQHLQNIITVSVVNMSTLGWLDWCLRDPTMIGGDLLQNISFSKFYKCASFRTKRTGLVLWMTSLRVKKTTLSGQISEAAELCKPGKMDGLHDIIWNSEDRQY